MARAASCGKAWRTITSAAAYQPLSTVESCWPSSVPSGGIVGPEVPFWNGCAVPVSYQESRNPFHLRRLSTVP